MAVCLDLKILDEKTIEFFVKHTPSTCKEAFLEHFGEFAHEMQVPVIKIMLKATGKSVEDLLKSSPSVLLKSNRRMDLFCHFAKFCRNFAPKLFDSMKKQIEVELNPTCSSVALQYVAVGFRPSDQVLKTVFEQACRRNFFTHEIKAMVRRKFPIPDDLREHAVLVQNEAQLYRNAVQCQFCSRVFKQQKYLDQHKKDTMHNSE